MGLSLASSAWMASGSEGDWGGLPNSVMSAPAMKVRPAHGHHAGLERGVRRELLGALDQGLADTLADRIDRGVVDEDDADLVAYFESSKHRSLLMTYVGPLVVHPRARASAEVGRTRAPGAGAKRPSDGLEVPPRPLQRVVAIRCEGPPRATPRQRGRAAGSSGAGGADMTEDGPARAGVAGGATVARIRTSGGERVERDSS